MAAQRDAADQLLAAEIQALERAVSRMLLDEEHFRSCMINKQIERMKTEEIIQQLTARLRISAGGTWVGR